MTKATVSAAFRVPAAKNLTAGYQRALSPPGNLTIEMAK